MKHPHLQHGGNAERAIVLFHGYGADMNDLAPLASYLDPQGRFTWYFPNGPVAVPFGGLWEGRAWFPIDMAELERSIQSGQRRVFADKRPAEFVNSLAVMEAELAALREKYPTLIVGGFSQGSMLASHLALRVGADGLVALSGTLLDRAGLESLVVKKNLRFFQSHGDQDPLLGLKEAKDLFDVLSQQGAQGLWAPFRGGHEIPPSVVQSLAAFLASF